MTERDLCVYFQEIYKVSSRMNCNRRNQTEVLIAT